MVPWGCLVALKVVFCTSVSLHLQMEYVKKDLKFLYITYKSQWFHGGVFLHQCEFAFMC